ncbi:MerR family transcriptional regulator [Streptomyces sp. NPDC059477]|uniref:MerR family transcriptional regulator n=1 Tax=Streptomyces sp. NPDC059477 TaxID=3346847 RepID=UPI003698DC6A
MRIGDAAAAAGTTPRALRFYEQRGLLPPPRRSPSGQRDYGSGELAVLHVIRRLLGLGLTVEDLRGIADRLPLLAEHPPPCRASPAAGDEEAAETGVVGTAVVRRRIAAIDAEIERLSGIRETLAACLAAPDAAPEARPSEIWPSEARPPVARHSVT